MNDYRSDAHTASQWQAEQAAYLNEPEHDQITEPEHGLDPDTLRSMLHLLIPPMPRTGKLSPGQVKIAVRRLFVLAAVVLPEVGAGGFSLIADALTQAGLATTRACISKIYLQLSEITGSSTLGRSTAAREAYSARAKQVWGLRTRKPRESAVIGAQEQ